MTTVLHSPSGPITVPATSPAFAAPPGLLSLLSVERTGRSYVCAYRAECCSGSMVGPLSPVSRLLGRVVVEVGGAWVVGEVGNA